MIRAMPRLPRNTTRQSEGLLYGELARTANRWSGIAILMYLALHLVGQGELHVGALRGWLPVIGSLAVFQYAPWVRAILFAAITFHFLYGLKLIALDLGTRLDYRASFLVISGVAVLTAVREVLRYAGL